MSGEATALDWTINGSCHRAGINEKLKDKWWFSRGHDFDIMTGVHVESSVNVAKARGVGQSILDSMTQKPAAEYSFTKSNQAITFSAK